MKKGFKIVVHLLISAIVLTSCGIKKNKAESNKKSGHIPVEVSTLKKSDIYNATLLTGTFTSQGEVIVVPKIPGTVKSMSLKVGDKVSAGDILATLDQRDVKDRINQAKTSVDSAVVAIEQSKVGLKQSEDAVAATKSSYNVTKANYNVNYEKYQNAKNNLSRSEDLYSKGIISKAEYERAKLDASDSSIKVLEAQLDQANNSVKQSERGVEKARVAIKQAESSYNGAKELLIEAEKSIEDTVVRSPISGIIATLGVKRGEIASNAKPMMTIVNVDKVRAKIDVTEGIVNKLKVGDKIDTYIVALSNKKVIGTVVTINPQADGKTKLYTVEIEVQNKDSKIKPGMFAKIKINTDIKKGVLVVKSDAVVTSNGQSIVYIEKDSKAVAKKVTIGIDNGEYTEITKGLNVSDRIIEKGQNYVENGTKVKVIPKKDSEGDKK